MFNTANMSETRTTLTFGSVALVLALLAFITAPSKVTPDDFLDQGEEFFPEFTDPNEATALRVIDYNEETGEAIPFKVVFENGKWSIPSHHSYPADGKDRLSKTAAGVIGIKKDDFRTDNISDHEACGVIDPLDENATSIKGRGKRVTLSGQNAKVLADFIIGKEIEDRQDFRFVRVPGQKRVYAVRMKIDISTKFSDWIESDLLLVEKDNIKQVVLEDYSINERTGSINRRDVLNLDKKDDLWQANKMSRNQEVDKTKMDDFLKALDELTIVGTRPKPQGLSMSLQQTDEGIQMSRPDMMSLQDKGFYMTRNGTLVSNEGELRAKTTEGVIYTLRFGEVAYGTGLEVSAGTESQGQQGPGENRYLFITTEFDRNDFKEPRLPKNTDFLNKADSLWTASDRANKEIYDEHQKWQEKIDKGLITSSDLNARFAGWYYVISSESFDKLNLSRKDLVKRKDDK